MMKFFTEVQYPLLGVDSSSSRIHFCFTGQIDYKTVLFVQFPYRSIIYASLTSVSAVINHKTTCGILCFVYTFLALVCLPPETPSPPPGGLDLKAPVNSVALCEQRAAPAHVWDQVYPIYYYILLSQHKD